MNKYVYMFDEGNKGMKELLGGKGANLAEMTNLGLPVPKGFIITTEVCDIYYKNNGKYPAEISGQIEESLKEIEGRTGKKLGDTSKLLLVSVRSGAAASMPGMMDTVLNIGLNDKTVEVLAGKTGNKRFAYDSYRRLLQMFGDVVMEVSHSSFEAALQEAKDTKGVKFDTELDHNDLKALIEKYKKIIEKEAKEPFPQEPREQLQKAIDAVFKSWNNERAISYRRLNKIHGLIGTAVNVQEMVFGNTGEDSGTGVCFTRNPSTGENKFYGEFLMNAQGEDVVAGIRTPQSVEELRKILPECYDDLVRICRNVETHYKDMQDMEFTIEEKKLFILQARSGKRTAMAAVRIASDMVFEGMITKEEAVLRIDPNQINQLLHKQLDPIAKSKAEVMGKGLPASPGAAVGRIVFSAERAVWMKQENEEDVVLVRAETSPEDIEGMNAAQGILTARGGMTSHAAVVARGMGKPCVAGCSELIVDEEKKKMSLGGNDLKEGDFITLDGSTGEVIKGEIPVVDPKFSKEFDSIMKWADGFRKLGVRTNAETPNDTKVARNFGAEGIGLCRTEHMFFEGSRITAMREMILSDDKKGREKALAKLLPMQRNDFFQIFEIMNGLPVTIRLLDPPLHEFLPKKKEEMEEVAKGMGVSVEKIKEKAESLAEVNPMLGFRGCRLGIVYPEINEMQVRAIFEAACDAKKKGIKVEPEVMIPVLAHTEEMRIMKELVDDTAKKVLKERKEKMPYKVGVMMELPRACLIADKIAEYAEFFSFGTNDLTQTTMGYSRDDAGMFIPIYLKRGIYYDDPFAVIDQEGVGQLIEMCVEKGRKARKNVKIGICGEHGGEPKSVEFCHKTGLDYVSCSPFRVPIARLAAAQAALRDRK